MKTRQCMKRRGRGVSSKSQLMNSSENEPPATKANEKDKRVTRSRSALTKVDYNAFLVDECAALKQSTDSPFALKVSQHVEEDPTKKANAGVSVNTSQKGSDYIKGKAVAPDVFFGKKRKLEAPPPPVPLSSRKKALSKIELSSQIQEDEVSKSTDIHLPVYQKLQISDHKDSSDVYKFDMSSDDESAPSLKKKKVSKKPRKPKPSQKSTATKVSFMNFQQPYGKAKNRFLAPKKSRKPGASCVIPSDPSQLEAEKPDVALAVEERKLANAIVSPKKTATVPPSVSQVPVAQMKPCNTPTSGRNIFSSPIEPMKSNSSPAICITSNSCKISNQAVCLTPLRSVIHPNAMSTPLLPSKAVALSSHNTSIGPIGDFSKSQVPSFNTPDQSRGLTNSRSAAVPGSHEVEPTSSHPLLGSSSTPMRAQGKPAQSTPNHSVDCVDNLDPDSFHIASPVSHQAANTPCHSRTGFSLNDDSSDNQSKSESEVSGLFNEIPRNHKVVIPVAASRFTTRGGSYIRLPGKSTAGDEKENPRPVPSNVRLSACEGSLNDSAKENNSLNVLLESAFGFDDSSCEEDAIHLALSPLKAQPRPKAIPLAPKLPPIVEVQARLMGQKSASDFEITRHLSSGANSCTIQKKLTDYVSVVSPSANTDKTVAQSPGLVFPSPVPLFGEESLEKDLPSPYMKPNRRSYDRMPSGRKIAYGGELMSDNEIGETIEGTSTTVSQTKKSKEKVSYVRKTKKKPKKDLLLDKWATDVTSHFNEVDQTELITE